VVCALLLDPNREVRASQLVELAAHTSDPPLLREVHAVLSAVDACAPETRLPLLDLAVPALRRMSAAQWRAFRDLVGRLVEADSRLDVFELALRRVLIRHVDPAFAGARPAVTRYYSLKRRARECSVLLSALAWRGGGEQRRAADSFARGAAHLPGVASTLLPEAECSPRDVEASLLELDGAAPRRKHDLLTACAVAIAHDGFVTVAEGELLRALADALLCPMPPLLPGEPLTA
jgi:hypothetical protein